MSYTHPNFPNLRTYVPCMYGLHPVTIYTHPYAVMKWYSNMGLWIFHKYLRMDVHMSNASIFPTYKLDGPIHERAFVNISLLIVCAYTIHPRTNMCWRIIIQNWVHDSTFFSTYIGIGHPWMCVVFPSILRFASPSYIYFGHGWVWQTCVHHRISPPCPIVMSQHGYL